MIKIQRPIDFHGVRQFLVVCTVILGFGMAAGDAAASKKSQIDELMIISGIERQLAQLPAMMQSQMAQQNQDIPPDLVKPMANALVEAYQPAMLLAAVRRNVNKFYDVRNMSGVLKWLKGSIGRRMTQMEIDASTVEAQKAQAEFAKSWKTAPPPKERVQLMLRFNEATQTSEFTVKIIVASFDGMMRGMMALMPENRITDKKLTEIKNKMVQQLAQPLLNQNIVVFVHTYREVNEKDMGRAITFYQSKAGKWYLKVIMDGLLNAMEVGGVRFGQKIESIVKNAPKRA